MKLIKNICITIAVCGFILALGTAGTSDLEYKTGQILVTEAQFYMRMLISATMLVCGSFGVKVCNITRERTRQYRAVQRVYRATHNKRKSVA